MLIKGNKELQKDLRAILLIQLGDIGDVVLTTPTLRALRENFPQSRLTVALRDKARGLIEDCPWVNEVIYISKERRTLAQELSCQKAFFRKLRRNHFDATIELRTGTRGAILSYLSGAPCRIGRYAEDGKLWRNRLFTHLVRPENELSQYCAEHGLNILAPFGLRLHSEYRLPELFVSPEKQRNAYAIFQRENVPLDKPIIAIQPFSLWYYKEWGIGKYVELIEWIRTSFSLPVVLIGTADERVRAAEIIERCGPGVHNLAGKTSLGELAALLISCDLLVGGDSAGIHIAAAVGTPTVSLFGPSSPVSWAPRGDRHQVIHKNWPCVPCRDKGCDNREWSRCLEELTVEEVQPVLERRMRRLAGATPERGLRD